MHLPSLPAILLHSATLSQPSFLTSFLLHPSSSFPHSLKPPVGCRHEDSLSYPGPLLPVPGVFRWA